MEGFAWELSGIRPLTGAGFAGEGLVQADGSCPAFVSAAALAAGLETGISFSGSAAFCSGFSVWVCPVFSVISSPSAS